MGGKAREGLTARTTHPQQEGVAQRLSHDASDAAHVFDGVHEEN